MKKHLILKSFIFSLCSLGLLGCISKKDETEASPIEQTNSDSGKTKDNIIEDNVNTIEEISPEPEIPSVKEEPPLEEPKEEVLVQEEPKPLPPENPIVKEPEPEIVEPEAPAVIVEPEPVVIEEIVEEKQEEPIIQEKESPIIQKESIIQEKKEEPPIEEEIPPTEEDSEYERSVSELDVAVSKETFELDKKEILAIIDNLDTVMKNKDFKAWLNYLDDESIRYYSQKSNLQKASKRLPIRGLKLNSLEDYFNYVFITSRKGTHIDEIRYETESKVRAVQVTKKETLIYYDFIRVDGKWKLHLSQISD